MSRGGKIALFALAIMLAAIIALVAVNESRSRRRQQAYADAKALYVAGQFEQAAELYAELNDEAWLRNCDRGIAERDAQALYDGGEPDEALSLLRERAPESALRAELAEAYAAALIEADNCAEALAVLQGDAPESENVARCERILAQIEEEQAFQKSVTESAWEAAAASLDRIEAMNGETGRLTGKALEIMRYIAKGDYGSWCVADGLLSSSNDGSVRRIMAQLWAANGYYDKAFAEYEALGDEDGMRAMLDAMTEKGDHGMSLFNAYRALGDGDGMRSEAERMLADGDYERAYEAYETLEDEAGKRKVIDAQAAAGGIARALNKLISLGDYEQAGALLDRVPAEGSLLSGRALACKDRLAALLESGDEAATALASRLADKVVEECRALFDAGKRVDPYYALEALRQCAGALWTEDWEALMDGCLEPMPEESFVIRDHSAQARPGDDGGTATITVYNESGGPRIICLFQDQDHNIYVYVRSGMYSFTVRAGEYSASVWRGEHWFGDREGFGPDYTSTDVVVVDGTTGFTQGDYLKGSYSLTLE